MVWPFTFNLLFELYMCGHCEQPLFLPHTLFFLLYWEHQHLIKQGQENVLWLIHLFLRTLLPCTTLCVEQFNKSYIMALFVRKWETYTFYDFEKDANTKSLPFHHVSTTLLDISSSRTTGIDDLLNVTIKIHFSVCVAWNCECLVVVSPRALLTLCFCCWSWQGFCHHEKASHRLSVWPAHSTGSLTVSAIDLLCSPALHDQNLETKDFSLSERLPLSTKWLWPLKTSLTLSPAAVREILFCK